MDFFLIFQKIDIKMDHKCDDWNSACSSIIVISPWRCGGA
eukprot:UN05934